MAQTYLLVDSMNMFFRSANSISQSAGLDAQIGMAFHIIFNSLRKNWRDHNGGHVVWCMEGGSWRKQFYPKYKLGRQIARLATTEEEQLRGKIMLEAFDEMCTFLEEKTNVTTLRCKGAEADDFISHWIRLHPDDNHVIISSDSDYQQLLAPNVSIYNGPQKYLLTVDGFFDEKGKPILDSKTKLPKKIEDPEYTLFSKCIRGDKSDYIFSAYPGVREKGTKNKVGMLEAYADRHNKGFAWNNFMLQKWTDHEGVEHTVKDKYQENYKLIHLFSQPEEVIADIEKTIVEATSKQVSSSGLGFDFLKFCGRWDLKKISDFSKDYTAILNAKY